jgi:hypothetical protein
MNFFGKFRNIVLDIYFYCFAQERLCLTALKGRKIQIHHPGGVQAKPVIVSIYPIPTRVLFSGYKVSRT